MGAERQFVSNDKDGIFHFENKENTGNDTADSIKDAIVRIARATLQANRSRDRIFAQDIFFDPAWDIMLMLYVAAHEGILMPLGDVVAELPGNPTTISRYVAMLEERGFLQCRKLHEGASPLYLELTTLAEQHVADALSGEAA